jgi:excisionase family DNA binding protein
MTIEPQFTISEVAKALKISRRTLIRWLDEDRIKYVDLTPDGKQRTVRIPASELERLGIRVEGGDNER